MFLERAKAIKGVTEETTTAGGYEAIAVQGFPADSIIWALEEGELETLRLRWDGAQHQAPRGTGYALKISKLGSSRHLSIVLIMMATLSACGSEGPADDGRCEAGTFEPAGDRLFAALFGEARIEGRLADGARRRRQRAARERELFPGLAGVFGEDEE